MSSGALATVLIIYWVIVIAVYVVSALAFFKIYKKADVPHAWMAWVPILNLIPYLWTIKKSAWNLLWLFVPIANIVFAIIWQVRLYKVFGMSPHWLWFYLLPGIGSLIIFIQHVYMGFSRHVTYTFPPSRGGRSNDPDFAF